MGRTSLWLVGALAKEACWSIDRFRSLLCVGDEAAQRDRRPVGAVAQLVTGFVERFLDLEQCQQRLRILEGLVYASRPSDGIVRCDEQAPHIVFPFVQQRIPPRAVLRRLYVAALHPGLTGVGEGA